MDLAFPGGGVGSTSLLGLLFAQTLQVTILSLTVWIAVRLVASDRPHLAHALWVLVLIKCITPPIWSSPASPFSWMAIRSAVIATSTRFEANCDPVSSVHKPTSLRDGIVVFASRNVPAEAPFFERHNNQKKSFATVATGSGANFVDQEIDRIDWPTLVFSLWMIGAGIGLLVSMFRFGWFLAWLSRCSHVPIAQLQPLLTDLRRRLGVRQNVRVLVVNGPVGPAVLGLLRPTILLPAEIFKTKPVGELEPLLAHELIHVRRGDLFWAMIQTLATSLFWFHPLVWLATRRVTRESERSCDEETIASLGCSPAAYARGLLDVLEQKHRLRVAPALPGVRPVEITSARLERVMRMGNGSHRNTPAWVWLVMLICGALVLPGAALVIAQETGQDIPRLPRLGEVYPNPLPDVYAGPGPNPKSESTEEPDWKLEVYDVARLLEQLKTGNLDEPTAEEKLLSYLTGRIPELNAEESSTPHGRSVELSTASGIVELGNTEPKIKIFDGKLYVFDGHKGREAIRRSIKNFNEFGFEQIVVQVRFMTTDRTEFEKLGIDWSIANASHATADSVVGQPQAQPIPASVAKSGEVRATSYIEKSSFALYSMIEHAEMASLMKSAQANVKTNLLFAPLVTMFNGQDAVIKDCSERPFVVGAKQIEDPETNRSAHQPEIRVIEEGTSITIKPVLLTEEGKERIRLSSQLILANIRDVQEFSLPAKGGQQQLTIQVPEVEKTEIQSTMDFELDETLVICAQRENEQGRKEPLLVFISCQKILAAGSVNSRPLKTEPSAEATSKAGLEDAVKDPKKDRQ